MESPMKKLKLSGRKNPPPKTKNPPKGPQVQAAESESNSSYSSSSISEPASATSPDDHPSRARARKALDFGKNVPDLEKPQEKPNSFSNLLDESDDEEFPSRSSFTASEFDDEASGDDFEDYFKKCGRFHQRGIIWDLCKPLREDDDNSLYYRIINDPKSAPDVAAWFVRYCSCRSEDSSIKILYRFFFDCAGYQVFDVNKYYGNFDGMLQILASPDYTKTVFKSTRFLLEYRSKQANIIKYGIYYFLQEFVMQAHESDILYGNILKKFTNLLIAMRRNAFRPLLYASYLFGMKLLTGICMVKERVADMAIEGFKSNNLDTYLNILYVHFTKGCAIADKNMATLKIESLKELKRFIYAAPKVFIDGYNCLEIVKKSVRSEVGLVRTRGLNLIMKIVENQNTLQYLNSNSKVQLGKCVLGRVCDIQLEVVLKAIEVYTVMATSLDTEDLDRENLPNLIRAIYSKDYRIASATAKCLIEIFRNMNHDDKTQLRSLCKIANEFYPNLKALMVEAFAEQTTIFRNWPLIMEILTNKENFTTFPIELRVVLSELFLESIHLTTTGKSSKQRQFSRELLHLDENEKLADEIYGHLKAIIKIYYNTSEEIIGNIFKALLKMNPDHVGVTSLKIISDILIAFTRMFESYTNPSIREPLLSFLLYVKDNFPRLNQSTGDVIEELQNNVTADLYQAFDTKDCLMVKTAALVFSKFDLNPLVEWRKLSTVWNISPDPEFVESILLCCHHSLMWKLRKIDTRQSKVNLDKDISSISSMSAQFLAACSEVLRSQKLSIRLKGFERICEFSISFSKHLQQISKQERALENLKLYFGDILENEVLSFLKAVIEPNSEAEARRFRKYIIYIRQLACAEIIPMDFLSNIFMYYDHYYEHYGKLIDSILLEIRKKDENWIAMLIVTAISILHKHVFDKHGAVDYRSADGKTIFSLSERFFKFKKIISPTISGKILFFAVNYVSENHLYDFLIYVTCFAQDTLDRQDIINRIQQKIPQSARGETGVIYLLKHLQKDASILSTKKAKPQPKPLSIKTKKKQDAKPPSKNLRNRRSSSSSRASGNRMSQLSLHDTSSDDLETTVNSQE